MTARARNGRFTRHGVPTLHVVMMVIGCSAMAASYTYSVKPLPRTIVQREVVEYQTVLHEPMPVAVCAGLPTRKSKREMQAIDTLAAAIPVAALRRGIK